MTIKVQNKSDYMQIFIQYQAATSTFRIIITILNFKLSLHYHNRLAKFEPALCFVNHYVYPNDLLQLYRIVASR
jgi:hypothetical protein